MNPHFKVLYSNDLTHILACASPYHRPGAGFAPEMLLASVDEIAGTGVDAHFLQPGFGWVPLWQSRVLPPSRHWEWIKRTWPETPSESMLQYVLDGGDIVADFIRHCRAKNMAPFISLRMNDTHHLDKYANAIAWPINFCEFYHLHPEYRLETESNSWRDRGQNWAIPAVREYKFNFIRELCANYELDGLELDFMRAPYLFRVYETSTPERIEILTGFIAQVRRELDASAAPGHHRYLCLRLPGHRNLFDALGIDLKRLSAAGVDMFNFSSGYYTELNSELSEFRAQAPDAAMYVEMTHCSAVGRAVEKSDGDTFEFHKTTPEQFYRVAAQAYDAGFDGVSLFNYVYYRAHGSALKKGISSEPPFELIKNFRDPQFLSAHRNYCFIGSHWEDDGPLPKSMMMLGKYAKFSLPGFPDCDRDGILDIQIDNPAAGDWEGWFNDRPIHRIASDSQTVLRWHVPSALFQANANRLEFRSKDIESSVIDYITLTTRGKS